MELDFAASSSRLQRDADKRKKIVLEKKALEKKKELERHKQLAEQEQQQREREAARLLEQERLEEDRAERERVELELTGGYMFEHIFKAVLVLSEEEREKEKEKQKERDRESTQSTSSVDDMDVAQQQQQESSNNVETAEIDIEAGEESDDKVFLSESCLNELVTLDLFGNPKHPALCFRLRVVEGASGSCSSSTSTSTSGTSSTSSTSGTSSTSSTSGTSPGVGAKSSTAAAAANGVRQTHCGVREFTAEEGTIGLPHSVWNNLRLPKLTPTSTSTSTSTDTSASTGRIHTNIQIAIKFVLLPKITYLLVQPVQHTFTQHIVEIKRCLEENLSKYTTLSVGNVVTVWYRGNAYSMIIKTVKRAASDRKGVVISSLGGGDHSASQRASGSGQDTSKDNTPPPTAGEDIEGGCLIDTNVIIDFMESVEYQRHQRENPAAVVPETKPPTGNTLGGSRFSGSFQTLAASTSPPPPPPSNSNTNESVSGVPVPVPVSSAPVLVPAPVTGMTDKELMRHKRLLAMQAREATAQNHGQQN